MDDTVQGILLKGPCDPGYAEAIQRNSDSDSDSDSDYDDDDDDHDDEPPSSSSGETRVIKGGVLQKTAKPRPDSDDHGGPDDDRGGPKDNGRRRPRTEFKPYPTIKQLAKVRVAGSVQCNKAEYVSDETLIKNLKIDRLNYCLCWAQHLLSHFSDVRVTKTRVQEVIALEQLLGVEWTSEDVNGMTKIDFDTGAGRECNLASDRLPENTSEADRMKLIPPEKFYKKLGGNNREENKAAKEIDDKQHKHVRRLKRFLKTVKKVNQICGLQKPEDHDSISIQDINDAFPIAEFPWFGKSLVVKDVSVCSETSNTLFWRYYLLLYCIMIDSTRTCFLEDAERSKINPCIKDAKSLLDQHWDLVQNDKEFTEKHEDQRASDLRMGFVGCCSSIDRAEFLIQLRKLKESEPAIDPEMVKTIDRYVAKMKKPPISLDVYEACSCLFKLVAALKKTLKTPHSFEGDLRGANVPVTLAQFGNFCERPNFYFEKLHSGAMDAKMRKPDVVDDKVANYAFQRWFHLKLSRSPVTTKAFGISTDEAEREDVVWDNPANLRAEYSFFKDKEGKDDTSTLPFPRWKSFKDVPAQYIDYVKTRKSQIEKWRLDGGAPKFVLGEKPTLLQRWNEIYRHWNEEGEALERKIVSEVWKLLYERSSNFDIDRATYSHTKKDQVYHASLNVYFELPIKADVAEDSITPGDLVNLALPLDRKDHSALSDAGWKALEQKYEAYNMMKKTVPRFVYYYFPSKAIESACHPHHGKFDVANVPFGEKINESWKDLIHSKRALLANNETDHAIAADAAPKYVILGIDGSPRSEAYAGNITDNKDNNGPFVVDLEAPLPFWTRVGDDVLSNPLANPPVDGSDFPSIFKPLTSVEQLQAKYWNAMNASPQFVHAVELRSYIYDASIDVCNLWCKIKTRDNEHYETLKKDDKTLTDRLRRETQTTVASPITRSASPMEVDSETEDHCEKRGDWTNKEIIDYREIFTSTYSLNDTYNIDRLESLRVAELEYHKHENPNVTDQIFVCTTGIHWLRVAAARRDLKKQEERFKNNHVTEHDLFGGESSGDDYP